MKHKLFAVLIGLVLMVGGAAVASGQGGTADTWVRSDTWENDLDYAQVRFVTLTQQSDGGWRFDVAVEHRDEGWDHYADQWEVVDPVSGDRLAERILAHPHEQEQPFTRSQSNITIPAELQEIIVRARCTVHGYGGHEVRIDLRIDQDECYSVSRK